MRGNAKKILLAAVLIVLAIFAYRSLYSGTEPSITFEMGVVDRGTIMAYVNSSGTVNPTRSLEVGSLISGIVSRLYVDFNSQVKKGDLLVKLDPGPFTAQLNQARADLAKAKAEIQSTKTVYESNKRLFERSLISKQEFDDSIALHTTAVATVAQAEAALALARANLASTAIRSPIDGIVISVRTDVGQAISAASGPGLFTIAEDISRMRVDGRVSEADIGKVAKGNPVTFTVDAYRGETFSGEVLQVRNEPVVTNNVVTYDVIILVANPGLRLKPGMTANVNLLVAERRDVLRLPRAAIRFLPPPEADISGEEPEAASGSVVWVPSEGSSIKPVVIETGVSNEAHVEVLEGLEEGDEVITGSRLNGTREDGSSPLGPIKLSQPKRF